MSRENMDIARRAFDAYQRGDIQTFLAAADPAIVFENPTMPAGGTSHGIDGMLGVIEDWVGSFDEFEMEIDELDESGDDVLLVVSQRGRGKDSGAVVASRFAFLLTFREGAVVRWQVKSDVDEARRELRAAG